MISFVSGSVDRVDKNFVIINNNGIGYEIKISERTCDQIEELLNSQREIKLYTHMSVKDDGMFLYGFVSFEELGMFKKLISVSGVGPKAAMSVISHMSSAEFYFAVLNEDFDILSKAPGIGRKTAQRIVLELKDKIKKLNPNVFSDKNLECDSKNNEARLDALEALCSLGYTRSNVIKTIAQIQEKNISTQDIIKQALSLISKR